MNCHRSRRGDWHSYVKGNLSENEQREMARHLSTCKDCSQIVSEIEEFSQLVRGAEVALVPPVELKINVMAAINQQKYRLRGTFHPLDLKNWGISMVAAGLILLILNPTPMASFISGLNKKIGTQLAQPFDKMGLVTREACGKLATLYAIQLNKQEIINDKGALR